MNSPDCSMPVQLTSSTGIYLQSPCERDGHNYQFLREKRERHELGRGGYFVSDVFFCTKCLKHEERERN